MFGPALLVCWRPARWCWLNAGRVLFAGFCLALLVSALEIERDYDELHVELAAVRQLLHEMQGELKAAQGRHARAAARHARRLTIAGCQ